MKMGKITYILISLCSLCIIYFFFWRISQILELQKMKKFEQNQKKYIQKKYHQQQDMMEQLAKVRHDEKNHMLTFQNLYQTDQEKAKQYFFAWHQQILDKISHHQDH